MGLANTAQNFANVMKRFVGEDRAGAQILTAMAMPLIVGFAGMGIDGANWLAQKRLTQNIADSAAIAAAHSALDHDAGVTGIATVQEDALTEAMRSGYEDTNGNTLQVTILDEPAVNGIKPRVEITVVRKTPVYFAGLFMDKQPTVAARAVSGTRELGNNCVIGLNESEPKTVYFTGSTTVTIKCGVTSNSESNQSLLVEGSATLLANPAQAVGDIVVSGSGSIISEQPLMPFHPPTPDPISGASFPPPPATCDATNLLVGAYDFAALAPATAGGSMKICGGADLRGDVDLAPGTYYIHDGNMIVNSQATVVCSTCGEGEGVTLVMSGDSGSTVGDMRVNGGATIMLDAPASGDFQGIVIYKQGDATGDGDNRFLGGSGMILNGVIYMPSQRIDYVGGSDTETCTYLIGDKVTFSGNDATYVRADDEICAKVGLAEEVEMTQQRLVVLLE